AQQTSALVAAPIAYLMGNDFERVTVDEVEVEVSSLETIQTAILQRAWIERTGPVHPGTTVPLKIQLQSYRGETKTETIPLTVPPNAPSGTYSLLVADGSAMTAVEQ